MDICEKIAYINGLAEGLALDGETKEAPDKNEESVPQSSLELEDALSILKLLKKVDFKGL